MVWYGSVRSFPTQQPYNSNGIIGGPETCKKQNNGFRLLPSSPAPLPLPSITTKKREKSC